MTVVGCLYSVAGTFVGIRNCEFLYFWITATAVLMCEVGFP